MHIAHVARLLAVLLFAALALSPANAHAQGVALPGVGAVNRSFGGASTAVALDAIGSLHWNPAAIAALERSEAALSMELLWADTTISSGIEPLGQAGETDSRYEASPIPAVGMVSREDGSPVTFGLGFLGFAGFRVDYPADPSNPILSPPPPAGMGLGSVFGEAEFLQVVPTVAYQLNERLAVGFAPTLTVARLHADPLMLTPPNTNGTYPPGSDPGYSYGGGFQAGALYTAESGINVGASFKSRQYIDAFQVNTVDASGRPRVESVDLDYPMIISAGVGYTGLERFVFAVDVRYFDYANTPGFEESGFDQTGAVRGVGWDSTYGVSTGIQYSPCEKWSLRAGYSYNKNPIPDDFTLFNLASPLIVEHVLGLGTSYAVGRSVVLSVAYIHGFENSSSGPIVSPVTGEIAGSSVENRVSADAVALSMAFQF